MSLAERQREVATLRVLGYGPWQIGTLLLRESLIVTLLGTVLGMPLGYLLTCHRRGVRQRDVPLADRHHPGTWIWTLVLAVVFGLIAHLFVQRSIHRMKWLDASNW